MSAVSRPCRLLWLRCDLRVHDHEALLRAAQSGARVVPVYCLDPRHYAPTPLGFPKTGARRARFLLESLRDLRRTLRGLGADLVVRRGAPADVLPPLAAETGAEAVYAHRLATHEELEDEREVAGRGLDLRLCWGGHTMYHVEDLPFAPADLPASFTAMRGRVERHCEVRRPLDAPGSLPALPALEGGAGEIPRSPAELAPGVLDDANAAPDPRAAVQPCGGETNGLARLDEYVWRRDLLRSYKETRNGMVGADYSSKFSPWLSLGCLSPRRVHAEVKRYERERVANDSTYWLVFELMWRDFFFLLALQAGRRLFWASGPARRRVEWAHNPEAFARWCRGETGVPFVDACMRELNATGFMSNRGRQNVASFLTKNLNVSWLHGAAYFESRLVDHEVTSNYGNWAYVGGVGNDPRDRYFNINAQARRYDPRGEFVRLWLPELAGVPDEHLLEPHRTPGGPPPGYPTPVVNLERSYREIRGAARGPRRGKAGGGGGGDSGGHGPSKKQRGRRRQRRRGGHEGRPQHQVQASAGDQ